MAVKSGICNECGKVVSCCKCGVECMTETISWKPVSDPPDDDITVMVKYLDSCSEPVWFGYHSDGRWHDVVGCTIEGVELWADMPGGPSK